MTATTTLIGNTTADVELRYTQNGKAVGNVTIVVQDRKLNRQTNEWEDGDKWFARCTVWGEMAEHAAQSIPKGTRVVASGRIIQREYKTREGETRSTVEVMLDDLGPSVRYATAQVTRTQGARGGQPGAQYGQQVDHSVAGNAYAGEQRQSGGQAQDVWSQQPYDEEAPF